MVNAARVQPPLFILGSPRSYTSLICAMIGQHPQCYGLPELNLFATDTMDEMVSQFTGMRQFQMHGLLRTVAQLYAGEQDMDSIQMAWRWILNRMDRGTTQVYQELAATVAPLVVVDKSPIYCASPNNLDRLNAAFPEARYLHLVRHPISQGQSILSVAGGAMAIFGGSIDLESDEAVVEPQIGWFDTQVNILEYLAEIPASRWQRLRGEDFLNDPDRHLRDMCHWLALNDDVDSIETMLHPENSPYAHLGPMGAHLGNDINFLRSPDYRRGKIKPPSLDEPLPWRPERQLFPEVRELAILLGYDGSPS